MTPDPIPVSEPRRHPARLNAALLLSILACLLIATQWYNAEHHFKALRKQVEAFQTQLMAVEQHMEELQGQQAALDAHYRELSQQSDSATIADIEETLLIANQQLQVVGDTRSALNTLEVSDERLARGGQADFAPLRKAFARDIANLQHASTLDVTHIGTRLDSALAEIDTLPLAIEVHRLPKNSPPVPVTNGESVWRQLVAAAWHEFRSLISIQDRNRTVADAAVLAPEQVLFLRQNLKLRLLGARLAWLGHDDADFKLDLQAAGEILNRYFAPENSEVVQLRSLVRELEGRRVDIIVPDLTGSLAAIHDYRVAHPQP